MTDSKKKDTDQTLQPSYPSETHDPRVLVFKPLVGSNVIVTIRHAGKDQDYYVEGKLTDVLEFAGADSTLVIVNANGPQLVPFNTMRPGKFRVLKAKESEKK